MSGDGEARGEDRRTSGTSGGGTGGAGSDTNQADDKSEGRGTNQADEGRGAGGTSQGRRTSGRSQGRRTRGTGEDRQTSETGRSNGTRDGRGDRAQVRVRDPGLQPERTRLAWRRTTLSGTVAAVLAARTALHQGASPTGLAVCALCCLLWLAFLLVAQLRIRRLARSAVPSALSPRLATAAVLCTAGVAVCAAALVV
jgi:hypothetical protein